jgi:protein gp37
MGVTSIQWTDKTWNPTRGCSRVSQGCVNCYAETLAGRYSNYGTKPDSPFAPYVTKVNGHASWTGKVELVDSTLDAPLHWKKPCRVFVNSMSDLFHEALPDEAIDRVFAVMALCPQHTFQILTKRPERVQKYLAENHGHEARRRVQDVIHPPGSRGINEDSMRLFYGWPLPNVWLGVSVEDQASADERIPLLMDTPAAVRFVSYEPALGPVNFECVLSSDWRDGTPDELPRLNWIICGGESGPGARPFDLKWARDTVAQCKAAGVAVFVKQLGAVPIVQWDASLGVRHDGKLVVGRCGGVNGNAITLCLDDRKGGDWDEWPHDLRIREFPDA